MQARLEAKIAGFGCMSPLLSAPAVGGHQVRRKAKSRNRTLIARGTGSSNPSPSSEESTNYRFLPDFNPLSDDIASSPFTVDGQAALIEMVSRPARYRCKQLTAA